MGWGKQQLKKFPIHVIHNGINIETFTDEMVLIHSTKKSIGTHCLQMSHIVSHIPMFHCRHALLMLMQSVVNIQTLCTLYNTNALL